MALHEIDNLYGIIPLELIRETPNVWFDSIGKKDMPHIDAIDRVIHGGGAFSPGSVGDVIRPWYMHPDQDDNLLVLHGIRHVEIYTPAHGKIEKFMVKPNYIERNGEIAFEGAAMLVWPRGVFHRIISDEKEGSASVNLATHYDSFDIKTNFNIYDLDPDTGKFWVIREGHLDQANV